MNNKLSILNLSNLTLWLDGGKGRASTYLSLKGFVDRGHEVVYITSSKAQKTSGSFGINVNRIKTFFTDRRVVFDLLVLPITTICFLIAGIKYGRKTKPDVIYAHSTHTALAAYTLSKLFKAKYVLRLYGVSYQKSTRFKISYLFLYLAFWKKADLYILTNDGTSADQIAKSFGVPEEKIFFLRNGINKNWHDNNVMNTALRKQYSPNNEKILLSVSRLTNWKQVDLIIKSLPDLIRLNDQVRLIIVGDGKERKNLQKLCEDLKVVEYVFFTGALQQELIKDYMSIADIFISMNSLSSLSNPVFEAMICGKPVIALNKGTTTDLIKDIDTGFLIEENELDTLPHLVNDILSNDELMEKIGRNAQKYMLEQWPSWEERVDQEVSLIESLFSNS